MHKLKVVLLVVLLLLSFLVILSVVKLNQLECKDFYKDMNNETINVTHYCNNRSCIIKCCGDTEILNNRGICETAKKFKRLYSQINYSNVSLYSWEGSAPKRSHKNLKKDLVFIQNDKFASYNCTDERLADKFYILENGALRVKSYSSWIELQALDFCVDYRFHFYKQNDTIQRRIKLIYREIKNTDADKISQFIVIGTLTSCVFLLLVLAVYCLLRQLRNIVGMILMAYVWSLFVTYLMRAILDLNLASLTHSDCKKLSPIVYYAALSSFFWLNIMSFDVWWTFRGTRKSREIHRRGEVVKFLWYCLYAWGAPLGLTIAAVILDNTDLDESSSIVKPPFDSCLADDQPVNYYLHVPIGVVCGVNIILFFMTAYNIWLVKRAVYNCQDSRKNKKEENRYIIYIKLGVMMGVGWCLELIPVESLWMFIVINFYNVYKGVAIFFLFVFKKSILVMLCNRFGINNKFVQKLAPQSSTSTSKNSTFKTGSRAQTKFETEVQDSSV